MEESETSRIRQKWLCWLSEIQAEAGEMLASREIYIEVRNMIACNPEVRSKNRFSHWMNTNYIHCAITRARRMTDRDERSISLFRLIKDMIQYRTILTREAHLALYNAGRSEDDSEDNEMLRAQANAAFDSLAGPGKNALPEAVLKRDLEVLQAKWKCLRRFANKRIAHLDEADMAELPKFGDLDTFIDEVEVQVRRYTLLLKARSVGSLAPTPQWDWKSVFRVAWLTKDVEQALEEIH